MKQTNAMARETNMIEVYKNTDTGSPVRIFFAVSFLLSLFPLSDGFAVSLSSSPSCDFLQC